jgi:hypothetical protein
MSSTPSSEDILEGARAKAAYVKAEIWGEFNKLARGFDDGSTRLTPGFLAGWEKKWKDACRPIDDIIFTMGLNPATQGFIPAVQAVLKEVTDLIQMTMDSMKYYAVSPEVAAAATPEPTMDEKERAREERRRRMAQFQGES